MFGDLNGSLGKEREKMNKEDIIKNLDIEYERKHYIAKKVCKVLDKINGFELELRACDLYTTFASLIFDADDLLLFEERLSELTEAIGDVKWQRFVTPESVRYEAYYFVPENSLINILIHIYVKVGPYCSIVKVPTGKKIQVRQKVEEVPEYEYRVDCGKNLEADNEEPIKSFADLIAEENMLIKEENNASYTGNNH